MLFRSRAEWGASYNILNRPRMNLPVAEVWTHHTVTNPTFDPSADMRAIEAIDIGRFGYPSYSYVIHPYGVVLEGMRDRIGAHTINRNSISLGISFIGNFENDTPTEAALQAFVELLVMLRDQNGWLKQGYQYPTGGHRDVFATACPGAHLYPLIDSLRQRVANYYNSSPPTIPTPPDLTSEVDLPAFVTSPNQHDQWWLYDGFHRRPVAPGEPRDLIDMKIVKGDVKNNPFVYSISDERLASYKIAPGY